MPGIQGKLARLLFSWRWRYRLVLTPTDVILERTKPSSEAPEHCHVLEAVKASAWGAAIDAGERLLAGRRAPGGLEILFSDTWARFGIVPLPLGEIADPELADICRGHLVHSFPDTAAWPWRISGQRSHLVAAAVPPALLDAMTEFASRCGMPLARAEPLFSSVFDGCERAMRKWNGWLLLLEPGMVCVGRVQDGGLATWHGQRFDDSSPATVAATILERQYALFPTDSREVRCLSLVGTSSVRLPAPWRIATQAVLYPDLNNGDIA